MSCFSCFSSKKQLANLSEGEASTSTPAAAPAASSTVPENGAAKTNKGKAAENTGTKPKIAIVVYSMYGHIAKLAEAVKAGIESGGGTATIFQIPETLPQAVLTKLHAPEKTVLPIMTPEILATYDAFVMGIPTRFGNFPAQWKAFWDSTGSLWQSGALAGKYGALFVSTASPGGGQESTALAAMSTLAHHGVNYVPFGYKAAFAQLTNLEEVHGGSPWGSGTFAGSDGSRSASELEIEIATLHGKQFYGVLERVTF